jgi:hypothetical protein
VDYSALTADPQDLEAQALMEELRARAREQGQQRTQLQGTLSRQQGQAGGLRNLSLLSSLGDNPLLRGVRDTAGQQGQQVDNLAARTEGRLANLGGGGMDPASALLRLRALGQGDRRIGLQESEAERKAKAAAATGARRAAETEAKETRGNIKLEGDLRKEFQALPAYKNFQIASVAYEQINQAFADPSAAGDIAGITSFMKSLDPETGVKDQEFNNASNAGGMYDKAAALLSKVRNGQRLTPEQRADFVRVARANVNALKRPHDVALEKYQGLGKSYNVDPSRVASPASDIDLTAPPSTGPAPAPGAAPKPATAQRSFSRTFEGADGKKYGQRADGSVVLIKPDGTLVPVTVKR